MKVRLMIGGLSNCPAVSLPQNRAKSENHPTQSGDVSPATAKRQRLANPLRQMVLIYRRLAASPKPRWSPEPGPRQRRPATQPVQGKGVRCGPTAHAYVEAGRSGIFIMISSAPSL